MTEADNLAAFAERANHNTPEGHKAYEMFCATVWSLYRAGRIAVIDEAPLKVGDVVCLPDGRQGPVGWIEEPREPYIRMYYGEGVFDFYTCPASYVSRGVEMGVKP